MFDCVCRFYADLYVYSMFLYSNLNLLQIEKNHNSCLAVSDHYFQFDHSFRIQYTEKVLLNKYFFSK